MEIKYGLIAAGITAACASTALVAYKLATANKLNKELEFSSSTDSSGDRPAFAEIVQLLQPADCTSDGVAYGGAILSMIDLCAGLCAYRYVGIPCVTVGLDAVRFKAPAKCNEVVTCRARLIRTTNYAMEIYVEVRAEDPIGREKRICCGCFVYFVAVDKDGKKVKVPQLKLSSNQIQPLDPKSDPQNNLIINDSPETCNVDDKLNSKILAALIQYSKQKQSMKKQLADIEQSISIENWADTLDSSFSYSHNPPTLCSPADFNVEMSQLVFGKHANPMQITFGGQILQWMEFASAISALRIARQSCVTVHVDNMSFYQPSKVGWFLVFKTNVNRVFRKSVEIHVVCVGYDKNFGKMDVKVAEAIFTFATLKDEIQYQIEPVSDFEKKQFIMAHHRRLQRLDVVQNSHTLDALFHECL